jgi:hypothetical protein
LGQYRGGPEKGPKVKFKSGEMSVPQLLQETAAKQSFTIEKGPIQAAVPRVPFMNCLRDINFITFPPPGKIMMIIWIKIYARLHGKDFFSQQKNKNFYKFFQATTKTIYFLVI